MEEHGEEIEVVICLRRHWLFYPLSRFPQGAKAAAPSPLGEGWDGGYLLLNDYFPSFRPVSHIGFGPTKRVHYIE